MKETRTDVDEVATDEGLTHVGHCHNDLTLCGLDASGRPWTTAEATCVVCWDLDLYGCDCPPSCECWSGA
jgi:hypothetical protein